MPIVNKKEFTDFFVVFRNLGPNDSFGCMVSIKSREKIKELPDTDLVVSLEAVCKNNDAKVYID